MMIKKPEDWWTLTNSQWENLLNIFDSTGAPMGRDEESHWWRDEAKAEVIRHPKSLAQTLEDARIGGDFETLHHFFELAWSAAPDTPEIHSWPGWGHLCDLCSEFWVFHPEEV
jgi:hypothetical protein